MSGRISEEIWQAVRDEYRAGALSNRAIASAIAERFGSGPSEAGIRTRAKKEKWERDLSEQVDAATRAKQQAAGAKSAKHSDIIEHAASRNFEALQRHMKATGRLAEVEDKLHVRLDKTLADIDALDGDEALAMIVESIVARVEAKCAPGKSVSVLVEPPAVIRAKLFKIASGCADQLAGSTAKRIQLERQALNLDKPDQDKNLERFVFQADFKGEARG